jgi:hypothetical protein
MLRRATFVAGYADDRISSRLSFQATLFIVLRKECSARAAYRELRRLSILLSILRVSAK